MKLGYGLAFKTFLFLLAFETVKCSKSKGASDIPCKEETTCLSQLAGSFCDIPPNANEGRCTCTSGIINDEKDQCLDGNVLIGNPCEKHEQCVGYDADDQKSTSECSTGSLENVCICRLGYVHSNANDKCLPIIDNVEDACEETLQCQEGRPGNLSICEPKSVGSNEKVCRCNRDAINGPEGSEDLHNRCFKKADLIGDNCTIHEQCFPNLNHSRCINNFCACNENYINSTDLTACLEKKNLGEICTDVVQCEGVAFASCKRANPSDQTGVCTCIDNYVPDKNKCYKRSLVDQSCQISDQCPRYSLCDGNPKRCTCNPNFISRMDKSECLPIANSLGDTCQELVQCTQRLPNTECTVPPGTRTGKCMCLPGKFVKSEILQNTCIKIVHEINLPCDENVQCTAGLGAYSNCTDGVCQCRHKYGYYNGTCHIPAKLYQPCDIVEQCYVGVNNLTVCHATPQDFQKRCQCLPGTEPVLDDSKCYDLTKKVGEKCRSQEECTVSILGHVYCDWSSNTCACHSGYSPTVSNSVCSSGADSFHLKSFIVTLSLLLIITICGGKAIVL